MLNIGCHLSSSKGFTHMGKEALGINPKLSHLPFFLETPNELAGYAQEIQLWRDASDKRE